MDPARASITALGASWFRAVHTRLDRPALIDDDWGYRFVTDADREMFLEVGMSRLSPDVREQVEALESPEEMLVFMARAHPSYGTIIIRTRYTEDALAAAVARGTRQCVIIGAGMDSLALRRPEFAREAEVFEIDHPATQELKLKRLSDSGVSTPTGVRYIPADLSLQGLDVALAQSGFDSERPTFFSWLGVTGYLTREANLNTLRAVAACGAAGSELVFSYLDQRIFDATDEDTQRVRALFASLGEPWVSGFHPHELSEDLRGVGLELVENLDTEDLRVRYCADRHDGFAPSPSLGEHIARARIAV